MVTRAPFAGANRLALAGYLRSKPAELAGSVSLYVPPPSSKRSRACGFAWRAFAAAAIAAGRPEHLEASMPPPSPILSVTTGSPADFTQAPVPTKTVATKTLNLHPTEIPYSQLTCRLQSRRWNSYGSLKACE